MGFEELLDRGSIHSVGFIIFNGDAREIYAHDKTGDLFIYCEDEDVGNLVHELGASKDMVGIDDVDTVTNHVMERLENGVIGAIPLKDGNYIDFLTNENGEVTWANTRDGVEHPTDFFLEVIMEEYD